MSDAEIWEAIRRLEASQKAQDQRLDDFEDWLRQVAQSAEMGAKVSANTLRLIQSQLKLARQRNDQN